MANSTNSFESNFTRKLAKGFMPAFESERVLSKNVDTQLLDGKFNPSSGDTTDFKRPTDYKSNRSAKGDMSAVDPDDIITGKASGVVQEYFTTFVDYDEADEALEMDELDGLLKPLARRIVVDFEIDFAKFMMKNTALLAGAVGTAVTTWDQVAEAGAVMRSSGVPMDSKWVYATNPFTQVSLASDQRSLGVNPEVGSSNQAATITDNFAGMRVMTADTLGSYTTFNDADRVGAIATSNPDVTYLTAKDTMKQDIVVSGFPFNMVITAGETLTITGVNRLNLSTREAMIGAAGAPVVFSGTVTADVTLSGTGTGTINITGPALFETAGQYNTVTRAPIIGDVVTLGGGADALIQPNLFWHPKAFSVGSVPIKKLQSTDTVATTQDGLQIRVSMGSDFLANRQLVRFDFRPAYAALNPFFAGQGFG